jgi:beta-mannosidase
MAKAQALCVKQLTDGWTFRQADDTAENAWMSVRKVPTNVHLDLMDNGKYVFTCGKEQARSNY